MVIIQTSTKHIKLIQCQMVSPGKFTHGG